MRTAYPHLVSASSTEESRSNPPRGLFRANGTRQRRVKGMHPHAFAVVEYVIWRDGIPVRSCVTTPGGYREEP
jgi:hypothetical protein